jgi:hypothetical protein
MKKIITIILLTIITTSLSATEFRVTLSDKHYKNSIVISPPEDIKLTDPEIPSTPAALEDSIIGVSDVTSGIKLANLTDGIWDCNVVGTYTSSSMVEIGLESPQRINYIISAGMGRLWKYPLEFYSVVDGMEVKLGEILTSSYCPLSAKTKITFPETITQSIIIRTSEKIYIGELEFGYE